MLKNVLGYFELNKRQLLTNTGIFFKGNVFFHFYMFTFYTVHTLWHSYGYSCDNKVWPWFVFHTSPTGTQTQVQCLVPVLPGPGASQTSPCNGLFRPGSKDNH